MVRRLARGILLALAVLAGAFACQSLRNSGGPSLAEKPDEAVRIATFNAHYIAARQAEGRWGMSGWEARKGALDRTVKALDADVIAFQEMETFRGGDDDSDNLARSYLLDQNPDLRAAATGNWRDFPSTQPIFFRADRFEALDQGWFFFSDTPDTIYSRTFDGSYPAFASWARFRDLRTGADFRVLNLHTDYSSGENRSRSVALVAERIRPWIEAGETVFLTGDLNARLGSELHVTLEEAGLAFVPVEGATYHLDRGLNLFGAIDHIGYAGASTLGAPVVLRERFGAVWASDHYPVAADFRIGPD